MSWPEYSDRLDDEYYTVVSDGSWLESKLSEGGTASARLSEQLQRARAVLAGDARTSTSTA